MIGALAAPARADVELPSPVRAKDVAALARARRPEIVAARARARAAAQRPAIASALEEPVISLSLDHVPFRGMGADGSLNFEQALPLSRLRSNRRGAAEAGARKELANAERVGWDIELGAVQRLVGNAEISGSHERAPDGFLLAYGAPVQPGRLARSSILDVTPTLLYYFGLPVGRDMDGLARTEIFRPSFTSERPVSYIPSYGR